MRVFISGATGYMGRALAPVLIQRGHQVCALSRQGSQLKVPAGCSVLVGNALDESSFASAVPPADVYVHLVGVAHPSPSKARQFREIDQRSLNASVAAGVLAGVPHFVYVSVAQPAPVMRRYQEVRSECEATIRGSGLDATILRPWYVLGPGHLWPYALLPFYRLAEQFAATRTGARRLGLMTLQQMRDALVWSVENPARGIRILDVPAMRGIRLGRAIDAACFTRT